MSNLKKKNNNKYSSIKCKNIKKRPILQNNSSRKYYFNLNVIFRIDLAIKFQ